MRRRNAIFLAAAIILAGCSEARKAETPAQAASNAPTVPAVDPDKVTIPAGSPKLTRIKVDQVQVADVPTAEVTSPAKVEANPNRMAHVVLPVAGRIVSVAVKIGDFVKQGETVLTVESPDVDTAISSYLQAQAGVTQAKAARAKAQSDMDRAKDLFDHNAIAQKEVINADAMLTQAKAAVEQAQAGVEQARRRLEILGVQPGQFGQRVAVRAPISGKVLEMTVVSGEFRNDTSAPAITIADLSTVWVTSDVPESSIRMIKPGERITVEFSAYPGELFSGRVARIADMVDPQTRTIKVRTELDNRAGRLRPEMFGQIRHTESVEKRPVIPVAAILQEDGRSSAWKESSTGVYQRVAVELGSRIGDKVAITKGLSAGDRVVTDGVMLLKAN
jgi:cobalt-zinc-cadmium efflux system membrane fusion protein